MGAPGAPHLGTRDRWGCWVTEAYASRLQSIMLRARTLAVLCSCLALTAAAQTADPANTAVARVFHPAAPLPSYDVATIKPFDPAPVQGGMRVVNNTTLRNYIRNAYGPGMPLAPAQVVGGPDWIDKDRFTIQGKPSPDLEVAMKKMTNHDWSMQQRALQQSLLADRFHLKVHFEVREMPVYTLVPAKGGLRIKAVDAPPSGDKPPQMPAPGAPPPPGMMMLMVRPGGSQTMRAGAIQISNLIALLSQQTAETGGRPVLDQTGFTGYFNVDNLTWAPLNAAPSTDPNADANAPSLATALEETLGLKLVSTKGPVEVVVIDSIDHPSDN